MNETGDTKQESISESKSLKENDSDVNGNKITSILNEKLYYFSPKWKNCFIRAISCTSMNVCVIVITYYGSVSFIFLVWLITFKTCKEIINLNPVFRGATSDLTNLLHQLTWIFLIIFFYICFGNSMFEYFRIPLSENTITQILMRYHPFISVTLYLLAIGYFICKLQPENYNTLYCHFGWIHTAGIYFLAGYLQVDLTIQGLIWTYFPVMLIVSNDILAYTFGFLMGRTPLVKLSPKKTWEGYLGAMLPTIIIGFILSQTLPGYSHFVCPLEYRDNAFFYGDCQRNPVFDRVVHDNLSLSENHLLPNSLTIFPTFFLHGMVFSFFAAVIAPITGGFLASGVKRAFNVKDFDNLIPGHGGILDRVDCQTAMTLFAWGYYYSFIHLPTENQLSQMLSSLSREDQMRLQTLIKNL